MKLFINIILISQFQPLGWFAGAYLLWAFDTLDEIFESLEKKWVWEVIEEKYNEQK